MKPSQLFLVAAIAASCLAAMPAAADDLSYAQGAGADPAIRETPDGFVLDEWSRRTTPFRHEDSLAAIAQEGPGAYGPLAHAPSDAGVTPVNADPVAGAGEARKPDTRKAMPYTFKYEHKHKTHANTTIEKLELARDLGHGFAISVAEEWLPRPKADKSAGDAFHRLEPYKTRLDIHYSRKLSHNVTFKHRFRNDFKKGKRETKPRFQLQVKLSDHFSVTPGYERINTYSKGKANLYQNQVSMALEYKWKKFKYKYTREDYYSTNGVIYDNTRHNYKNKYVIGYAGKRFEPYLEVRNVSRSSTKPGRDDDVRLGVKYRF